MKINFEMDTNEMVKLFDMISTIVTANDNLSKNNEQERQKKEAYEKIVEVAKEVIRK